MNDQMTEGSLPISIKLISGYYFFIAFMIVFLASLLFFGVNFLGQVFKGELHILPLPLLLILVLAVFIAILPYIIGRGILKRSKVFWLIAVISSSLAILSAIAKFGMPSIVLLTIHILFLWKLLEHRKLFGW